MALQQIVEETVTGLGYDLVEIERSVIHPLYRKVLRRVTKFKAHDEANACKVGDRVRMIETRPISKDKHMRVIEVVEKGQGS